MRLFSYSTPWRKWWRTKLRPFWSQYQWLVVWAMAFVAMGLGYWGFKQHAAAAREPLSALSLFYRVLQLFVLESGAVMGAVPWQLDVARYLAPAVSAYTATMALALIFKEQLQHLHLRFRREHVVICGLGRKGLTFAKTFQARGDKVVVVENDAKHPLLARCRELGALVYIGDAAERETLRAVNVAHARYLIAVCREDGVNAEVAVNARELFHAQHGKVLACWAHIVDTHLCKLLREHELSLKPEEAFRLEFFNVYERGARAMLEQFPVPPSAAPHLAVLGMGRLGENLVLRAAKAWYDKPATETRLRLTVLDRAAEHKVAALRAHYPKLESRCDVVPVPIEFGTVEFERGYFIANAQPPISAFYVCLDNDARGLSTALTLLPHLRAGKAPIIVRMVQSTGLATLIADDGDKGSFEKLSAFGMLTQTCTPELLLHGTRELLARAIHEDYLQHQRASKLTPETNPAILPWEQLPEHMKESNRSHAAHIGVKLHALQCGMTPARDWALPEFQFTPQEIEKLAVIEHDRWCAERRREGWRFAQKQKDLIKKTTPYLVGWERLPEEIRELDRHFVRRLPAILARAGFEIYRMV